MTETNTPDPVIVFYEVFTGVMPDGRQVMVQLFRRKGEDRSMTAQIAFREQQWQTWGPPTRLDDRHELAAT
jgi:hypothetical protein